MRLALQSDEMGDEDTEPLVPAGLGDLSASLQAIADFLEIDEDLIAVAAAASPAMREPGGRAEWVASLPAEEKDALLARVAAGEGAQVQALLLRRFRAASDSPPAAPARTAAELWEAADPAGRPSPSVQALLARPPLDDTRLLELAARWEGLSPALAGMADALRLFVVTWDPLEWLAGDRLRVRFRLGVGGEELAPVAEHPAEPQPAGEQQPLACGGPARGDGGAAVRPRDSATTTLTSFLALPRALAQHWAAASASRPPAIKL